MFAGQIFLLILQLFLEVLLLLLHLLRQPSRPGHFLLQLGTEPNGVSMKLARGRLLFRLVTTCMPRAACSVLVLVRTVGMPSQFMVMVGHRTGFIVVHWQQPFGAPVSTAALRPRFLAPVSSTSGFLAPVCPTSGYAANVGESGCQRVVLVSPLQAAIAAITRLRSQAAVVLRKRACH